MGIYLECEFNLVLCRIKVVNKFAKFDLSVCPNHKNVGQESALKILFVLSTLYDCRFKGPHK